MSDSFRRSYKWRLKAIDRLGASARIKSRSVDSCIRSIDFWSLRRKRSKNIGFRDVVPIAAVEELTGGIGITHWKRLNPWVHSIRSINHKHKFLTGFNGW